MENHPIPQDITGYEFKLIGNMTLKQFAYLAGGFGTAWVIYILPIFIFIKIPFVVFFAAFGAGLAFLPIEGRPMDLMIKNFFKAVFNPTQYVYEKAGGTLLIGSQNISDFNKRRQSVSEMSEKQLSEFIENLPKFSSNKLDKKEMVFFQNINDYGAGKAYQPLPAYVPEHSFANQAPSTPPINQAQQVQQKAPNEDLKILTPNEDLQKTAALLQKELAEAKEKEAKEPQVNSSAYLAAHQKVLELQKNLNDLLLQKQNLETKLMSLQKQMQEQGKPVYSPSIAKQQVPRETQFVKSIPQNMTKSAGLPSTPEFPNIITGIIIDPRGNPLPNILVEVKDAQGNAVRAFKTNALGHFVSATPLNNGGYTIEFEDTSNQNRFDSVAFEANGGIILPMQVTSVDNREELRRSLFN